MNLITQQQIAQLLRNHHDHHRTGDHRAQAAAIMELIAPLQSALIRIAAADNTRIKDPECGHTTVIDAARKMRTFALDALNGRPVSSDEMDLARAEEKQHGERILAQPHGWCSDEYAEHRRRLAELDWRRDNGEMMPRG